MGEITRNMNELDGQLDIQSEINNFYREYLLTPDGRLKNNIR